ncbi:MAG: class I SAM-dependent rRNA methyltransferase [Elainella sp. Prado103]|jgi:23S rRNA (cytosine1962-C5)-methyltransferase|nr:class I SAM-dependent rRNA methyltransferase [Elainella sp. Prado103]
MVFPRLILHKHKADAVRRFHPWIFSGAIKTQEGEPQAGDVVEVYSDRHEFLAMGHYGSGSIAVKIFSFEPVSDLSALLTEKLQSAYQLRQRLGLVDQPHTNCYRLVNAEGDGFPGLIIDWYNGVAVMQSHSIGMYQQREWIATQLRQIYGDRLKAIYDKSASVLWKQKTDPIGDYLWGESQTGEVLEYGNSFQVDWETGQKTGFFVDQREHRRLLAEYAKDQKILNTFCYSGGFSVYALRAGAKQVDSVDSSVKAIGWTKENIDRNGLDNAHAAYIEDVFTFLKECDSDYDVIVLDPPAFAKSLSARHQAVMAYKRLNQLAINKLRPNGLLFTFSCSQVVIPEYFNGAVTAAAIEMGRPVRILHHLTQPSDHPVSIYHPEGLYLKGLVLQVG